MTPEFNLTTTGAPMISLKKPEGSPPSLAAPFSIVVSLTTGLASYVESAVEGTRRKISLSREQFKQSGGAAAVEL